jgi:hypothetical protein
MIRNKGLGRTQVVWFKVGKGNYVEKVKKTEQNTFLTRYWKEPIRYVPKNKEFNSIGKAPEIQWTAEQLYQTAT